MSSPGLTYGSSAASEESSSSVLTPSSSSHSSAPSRQPDALGAGAQFSVDSVSTAKKNGAIQFVEPEFRGSSQDTGISGLSNTAVPFPELPIPARPTTPSGIRKLKKKPRGDGYESDGGYMSETGKKKEKKAKKEKKKADQKDEDLTVPVESEKDAKKRATKEEKKEQEEERKRKKSFLSAAKASKKAENKEAADQIGGNDTDGAVGKSKSLSKSKTKKSKSKTESAEGVGYETDGAGYQSSASVSVKKSKSGFFSKLTGKSSRTDLRADVEPVPALPPPHETEAFTLPIAERFATSLSPATLSTSSLSESRPTPSPVVPLPSSHLLGLPPPLPPLDFQSFNTSASEPPMSSVRAFTAATASSPVSRSSHSSSDSSSSNGSKRFGAQFSPTRDNGSAHGHGFGSGSFSTITSSSHQHSVQHHMPTFNPAVSPNTPNSLAHSDHSGSGSLKPPSITYPNTRSPSPSTMMSSSGTHLPTSHPPVAPLQIAKGLRMRPSYENFMPSSKKAGPSSSPISPAPPWVSPGPLRPATSPAHVHPPSHLSPSPNPVGGYPPRSRRNSSNPSPLPVISSPNTAISEQSKRATHLTITPSSDYLVPSPRNSTFPSPNVLAYYDIPPPSPPPMGPLPSVPAGRPGSSSGNANPNVLPSPAALRQRLIDRPPRQFPSDIHPVVHPPSNIQRGRESPFPSRPVLPIPGPSPVPAGPSSASEGGLARRYGKISPPPGHFVAGGGRSAPADVYANSRYQEEKDGAYTRRGLAGPGPKPQVHWIDEDREDDDSVDDDDSAKVELRDVLDRFDDGSGGSAESHYEEPGRALERSHSIEAMKNNRPVSEYYGARPRVPRASSSNGHDGEYQFEDGRTVGVGDRLSRWSGSVYSRASILDEDESGETRDRLVKRIEEMLDLEAKRNGDGAGRGHIPPVPRLPNAYANANMGALPRANAGIQAEAVPMWNKF